MVGEKLPFFYGLLQRKIRNNTVYCYLVAVSPLLVILFLPQFAVFTAVLLAPMFEGYGLIGTLLSWSVVALWVAPIPFLWHRTVKKRMKNYLALLVDRKPLDINEAREYIIEVFKRAKTATSQNGKSRERK